MVSGDCDINDVFDDILLTEEALTKDGYNEGYQQGLAEGNIEGYRLGYTKGFELGGELGYYYGTVAYHLRFSNSGSIKTLLQNFKQSIDAFPGTNDPTVDILFGIEDIRSQFKRIKAALKLRNDNCSSAKAPDLTF